jgi:gluconate 5-dehydrogenase
MFSLKGKTALLSGGSGFFGPYFAAVLKEAGATVITAGREGDYPVDYYDERETHARYESILREHRIDILVNNAFDFSKKTGFNDPSGRIERMTRAQFAASMESGVYWAERATQVFGIPMREHGGSIINICSMYAVVVPSPDLYEGTDKFNPPGYSASKAALLQFTRYSASFLGPKVRVNAISPGAIPNLETATFNAPKPDDPILRRLTEKTILKRLGHPSDLVGALVFLASDASSYMTGQNVIIDGGLTVL